MSDNKPKPFLKFLIDDFKSDWQTLKEIFQGKYKCKYTLREIIDIRKALQEYWLFFLIIILAFFVGRFYESQRCQDQCNTFIIENYLEEEWRSEDYQNYISQQTKDYQAKKNQELSNAFRMITNDSGGQTNIT